MANHLSAKKAYRQTIKKTLINKSYLSAIKTCIKKVILAVQSGSSDDANKAFILAQSKLMKGVNKKILKLNTASRKLSRLSLKISNMNFTN